MDILWRCLINFDRAGDPTRHAPAGAFFSAWGLPTFCPGDYRHFVRKRPADSCGKAQNSPIQRRNAGRSILYTLTKSEALQGLQRPGVDGLPEWIQTAGAGVDGPHHPAGIFTAAPPCPDGQTGQIFTIFAKSEYLRHTDRRQGKSGALEKSTHTARTCAKCSANILSGNSCRSGRWRPACPKYCGEDPAAPCPPCVALYAQEVFYIHFAHKVLALLCRPCYYGIRIRTRTTDAAQPCGEAAALPRHQKATKRKKTGRKQGAGSVEIPALFLCLKPQIYD